MSTDGESAGGLTEDRHPSRVSAERLDVVTHPLERELLIEEPVIPDGAVLALRAQFVGGEEALRAEAVVDVHDDHTVVGEFVTDVVRLLSRAVVKPPP